MSGPTISSIAGQAGVLQQVVTPKKGGDVKDTSDSRNRHVPGGDDEEGDKKTGANAKGGGGKAGAAGSAKGSSGTQRTRRKKVSIGSSQGSETSKTDSKGSASEVRRGQEASPTAKGKDAQAQDAKALGYAKAAGKLNEQSQINKADALHRQKMNDQPQNPLSPMGVKRQMLNGLISYAGNNYHQHTGDKAGEVHNRRGAREVFTALKGLRSGNQGNTATSSSDVRGTSAKFDAKKLDRVQFAFLDEQPAPEGHEPVSMFG